MLTIHEVEQRSPEWFKLRDGLVTGSNAFTLLTRGKNAAINNGQSNGGGYWAKRGKDLEPQALEIYQAVFELPVVSYGFITNSDYPGCGYSPDGIVPMQVLDEVKCFAGDKHDNCLTSIPNEVYAQIQFGLMICELEVGHLILYNPDMKDLANCFKVHVIDKDEKLINRFKVALYD
jgi:hypothetical protein